VDVTAKLGGCVGGSSLQRLLFRGKLGGLACNGGLWCKTKRSSPHGVLWWNRFSLSIEGLAWLMPKGFLPETFSKILVHLLGDQNINRYGHKQLTQPFYPRSRGDFITAELLEP